MPDQLPLTDILRMAALALLLPVTIYTELKDGKIYNWLTLPAVALGIFIGVLVQYGGLPGLLGLSDSLFGAAIGGGMFFIPYVVSGLSRGVPVVGGGDVKFAAAVGALMGPRYALLTAYYSVILGTIIGISTILWRKYRANSNPDAPKISIWTMRIPFGTALCLGVMLAFYDVFYKGKF